MSAMASGGCVTESCKPLPGCYPSPKNRGIIRKSSKLNSVRDPRDRRLKSSRPDHFSLVLSSLRDANPRRRSWARLKCGVFHANAPSKICMRRRCSQIACPREVLPRVVENRGMAADADISCRSTAIGDGAPLGHRRSGGVRSASIFSSSL